MSPQHPGERWRPLPTGPGVEFAWAAPVYWVSDFGRVRGPQGEKKQATLRIGRKAPHLTVGLSERGVLRGGSRRCRKVYVHRLVLAAFAEPDGLRPIGRHGPGGSLDNRLANLTRGTFSENLRDAYERGEREPLYTGPSHGAPF